MAENDREQIREARTVTGKTVDNQVPQESLLHPAGHAKQEASHTHHASHCNNLSAVAVMKYCYKMQATENFVLTDWSRGGGREGTAARV